MILPVMAIFLASNCTKETVPAVSAEPEIFSLKVSVPSSASVKAVEIPDEDNVASLQVFIFRPDGLLESYGRSSGNTVTAECTSGDKEIVALANAPDVTDVTDKASLDSRVSYLKENRPGAFVMYGSKTQYVSASSGQVSVDVTRLVARVSIGKITNNLALAQHAGTPISIRRIYLVNAAGDMMYGDAAKGAGESFTRIPSVWLNRGECTDAGDLPDLLCSGNIDTVSIAHGASYETAHYFYCYPNPATSDTAVPDGSAGYTKLVVEVSVKGSVCYYPIPVTGIRNNHTYSINELIIERIGSEDPNVTVDYGQASFTVSVNEWKVGDDVSVTI